MYINKVLKETGCAPSFEEMKNAVGLKSKSGIHALIEALIEREFIRKLPHKARALEVVRLPKFKPKAIIEEEKKREQALKNSSAQIPLYGKIAAGTPIEAIADETGNRLQSLADKIDAKINELKFLPDQPANAENLPQAESIDNTAIATIITGQAELKTLIESLGNPKEGHTGTTAADIMSLERNITAAFAGTNAAIEDLKAEVGKIKERNAAPQINTNPASVAIDNTAATTVQAALHEFEDRLNLIAKDVMVMRNSTHSILKNMETQLIDRSSKESRASLIIAIGARAALVIVLLKLYGEI